MKIENMEKLLVDQLKDIYSAESQLIKALPKMAKAASSEELKEALLEHLDETKAQQERLDKIGELLEVKLTGKKCKAMEGLIEEGDEAAKLQGPEAIVDCAIVAAAQRVEHYEISAYGTARTLAEELGFDRVVTLLQKTIEEEGNADKKLTAITMDELIPQMTQSGSMNQPTI